tara:strand:+ start:999 stop:2081 length:1083 start_codon:yes stop_codon:yes gene_type:complete
MKAQYEERMQMDLDEVRRKFHKVATLVEDQLRDTVQALIGWDKDLATKVILGDRQVNRRIQQIDSLCHTFIIRHAPSAGHLRFASAVLRLNVALERIGDYAGTIGREVLHLTTQPPERVTRDIEIIAQQARHALGEALTSFFEEDLERALQMHEGLVRPIDLTLSAVLGHLVELANDRVVPLKDSFALVRINNLLKRVSEQADNISEQAIFAITGEEREPRIYRILFVGHENNRASQIAEAYAEKAYPTRGVYTSAGLNPAGGLDPALIEFMDERGMDVKHKMPSPFTTPLDSVQPYHVIIALEEGVLEHITEVPFRTIVLEWAIDIPEGFTTEVLEDLYKMIAVRIQDLMKTLAGPDAH